MVMEREYRRGGVMDLDIDLVKLRPRSLSLPFPLLAWGGLRNIERRLSSRARVRECDRDRDFEYEDPVYDE